MHHDKVTLCVKTEAHEHSHKNRVVIWKIISTTTTFDFESTKEFQKTPEVARDLISGRMVVAEVRTSRGLPPLSRARTKSTDATHKSAVLLKDCSEKK